MTSSVDSDGSVEIYAKKDGTLYVKGNLHVSGVVYTSEVNPLPTPQPTPWPPPMAVPTREPTPSPTSWTYGK